MASLVLRFLISFQEAPWYGLVYYVLEITTTRKGLFVPFLRSKISIATVIYQCWSYLFDREIHLLRFICWYCTSIYDKYIILLCYICNHHRNLLFQKFGSIPLWYFQTQFLLQTNKSTTYQFSITPTCQTLKDGYLSGVGWLWRGR